MLAERETPNRLELCALSKSYGAKYALRDVTLTLYPGVTALLGHNGAGKSTLMQILATTARPTSGELRWNGEAIGPRTIDRLRARLGYVPQQFAGYPQQTVDEFLTYIARLRGIRGRDVRSRVATSLDAFALQAILPHPVERMQSGHIATRRYRASVACGSGTAFTR